jgi:hypothetical protein
MNLKLRRLVRTPSSEQYALFDPDRTDDNYDPISIGKLDVHYADEGVYGTFLLWQQAVADLPPDQLHALVEATLQELCEPIGLPVFYAVEFFSPDLASYKLHSNEEEEEEEEDTDQDQDQEDGNQDDTE